MQDTLAKRIGRIFLRALGASFLLGAVVFPFVPQAEFVRQNLELETIGARVTATVVEKETLKEEVHNRSSTHLPLGRAKGLAGVVRLARNRPGHARDE